MFLNCCNPEILVVTIEASALAFPNLSTAFIKKLPVCAFTVKEFDFLLTSMNIRHLISRTTSEAC